MAVALFAADRHQPRHRLCAARLMLADLEDDGRGAGGRKAPCPPADARASRRDCGGDRLHAVSWRSVLSTLVRLARSLRPGSDDNGREASTEHWFLFVYIPVIELTQNTT